MKLEMFIKKIKMDKFVTILVKDHKTGSKYPAVLVIDHKYIYLFDYYCENIRPASNSDNFFLNSLGKIIQNPGKMISRLHSGFKITLVNSDVITIYIIIIVTNILIHYKYYTASDARKAVETNVSRRYADNDPFRILMADLLTLSVSTAKDSYVSHVLADYANDKFVYKIYL